MNRNGCSSSIGIGVQHGPEYAIRRRSDWTLLILGLIGIGFMLSAIAYEERFGEGFEQMATVIGGLLLVALHLINRHRLLQIPQRHTA